MTTQTWINCDLEYLTPEGTWEHLSNVDLLYPERYAERLENVGKVGRARETAKRGRIWASANEPSDPSILVPVTDGTPVPWRLPSHPLPCSDCHSTHPGAGSGECLL